jgi:DNA-binding MarR family transcriptional regulator
LRLTEKSRAIRAQVETIIAQLFEDMLCGLSESERATFAQLLGRVGENISAARVTETVNG